MNQHITALEANPVERLTLEQLINMQVACQLVQENAIRLVTLAIYCRDKDYAHEDTMEDLRKTIRALRRALDAALPNTEVAS